MAIGAGLPITSADVIALKMGTWTSLTLVNGWVNYGFGFPTAAVGSAGVGLAAVRLMIKSGTTTAGVVVTTLPVGARPTGGTLIFPGLASGALCEWRVETDGDVIIAGGASATWTALNCVFPTV